MISLKDEVKNIREAKKTEITLIANEIYTKNKETIISKIKEDSFKLLDFSVIQISIPEADLKAIQSGNICIFLKNELNRISATENIFLVVNAEVVNNNLYLTCKV